MKRSLRQSLADSHIATVTIAVLLLWSLDGVFHALLAPVFRAVFFLFTAAAIRGIPHYSPTFTLEDRIMLVITSAYLGSAVVSFLAAWLLSRWAYGVGPVRSLTRYSKNPMRRKHV
jgi:hypothetical protein